MKKILNLVAIVFITFAFTSCEEDLLVFDAQNGQTAVSFGGATTVSLSVPEAGLNYQALVNVTTVSASDRTFPVTVIADQTTGASSEYTVGSVVVPANQHVGNLSVQFNYAAIADGAENRLVLKLSAPEGGTSFKDVLTINYFREIVCNDVVVRITLDNYPDETRWEIRNSTNTVVANGGPYAAQAPGSTVTIPVTLADGCYTFIIYDQFSDGICCAYGNGSYAVTCSILVHASGGQFGASETTPFCVNQ